MERSLASWNQEAGYRCRSCHINTFMSGFSSEAGYSLNTREHILCCGHHKQDFGGAERKICGICLYTLGLPRPDMAGRCDNSDPVGIWWSVACGKSLCRDRCPPAAAAQIETRLHKERGGVSTCTKQASVGDIACTSLFLLHVLVKASMGCMLIHFLELDEKINTAFTSVPKSPISKFLARCSPEAPDTGWELCHKTGCHKQDVGGANVWTCGLRLLPAAS